MLEGPYIPDEEDVEDALLAAADMGPVQHEDDLDSERVAVERLLAEEGLDARC